MDDRDLIETKAHAFIEGSRDLDSLAKAASILRDLDDQRKIRAELHKAQPDADRAASERTSEKVRFWTATLLPTLAFIVTAGAFIAQIQQGKNAVDAQEDSQWRSALEKTALGAQSARIGVLEMQSFFHSPRYHKQSRSVAATLLREIDDRDLFDIVFFDLVEKTAEQNQQELITLARALGDRLKDRYALRKDTLGNDKDGSFSHFLKNPEDFYDDNKDEERKLQLQIDLDEANLDSICVGLIGLWKDSGFQPRSSKRDLAGIAFYTKNGDYAGVDFRGADLKGAAFYGGCDLGGAKFDGSAQYTANCEKLRR